MTNPRFITYAHVYTLEQSHRLEEHALVNKYPTVAICHLPIERWQDKMLDTLSFTRDESYGVQLARARGYGITAVDSNSISDIEKVKLGLYSKFYLPLSLTHSNRFSVDADSIHAIECGVRVHFMDSLRAELSPQLATKMCEFNKRNASSQAHYVRHLDSKGVYRG